MTDERCKHVLLEMARHSDLSDQQRFAIGFAIGRMGRSAGEADAPFQARVQPWMLECFGPEIAADKIERNHRFFEEATELVQACGMTASEAHQLVDYTFGRPVGEPTQETGGVMVTLAALCLANGLDMHAAGETELARISIPETVAKIRAKQAAKPKHSPLPAAPAQSAEPLAHKTLLDALGYPWLPCPICKGTEGCDHPYPERACAALAAPQPSPTAVALDERAAFLAKFGALNCREGSRAVGHSGPENGEWEDYVEVPVIALDRMQAALAVSPQPVEQTRALTDEQMTCVHPVVCPHAFIDDDGRWNCAQCMTAARPASGGAL